MQKSYTIKTRVWLYPGMAGWHFVTIPKEVSDDITAHFELHKKGFGSIPVGVMVGKTSWKTSVFPDKETQCYLLPLKAEVRKKEGIKADNEIVIKLELKI